jgi:hypothetical protein
VLFCKCRARARTFRAFGIGGRQGVFFLLCFSVNIECTSQVLRRALGIGGRPRHLVLTGQDLPRALGIGSRPRALVLDLPRAIGIGGRQGVFFLLCFSVNVECTGQDLRRALGIGGRPRALVLTGQDLPRAFGIGGRSRALVLFCKCRA